MGNDTRNRFQCIIKYAKQNSTNICCSIGPLFIWRTVSACNLRSSRPSSPVTGQWMTVLKRLKCAHSRPLSHCRCRSAAEDCPFPAHQKCTSNEQNQKGHHVRHEGVNFRPKQFPGLVSVSPHNAERNIKPGKQIDHTSCNLMNSPKSWSIWTTTLCNSFFKCEYCTASSSRCTTKHYAIFNQHLMRQNLCWWPCPPSLHIHQGHPNRLQARPSWPLAGLLTRPPILPWSHNQTPYQNPARPFNIRIKHNTLKSNNRWRQHYVSTWFWWQYFPQKFKYIDLDIGDDRPTWSSHRCTHSSSVLRNYLLRQSQLANHLNNRVITTVMMDENKFVWSPHKWKMSSSPKKCWHPSSSPDFKKNSLYIDVVCSMSTHGMASTHDSVKV